MNFSRERGMRELIRLAEIQQFFLGRQHVAGNFRNLPGYLSGNANHAVLVAVKQSSGLIWSPPTSIGSPKSTMCAYECETATLPANICRPVFRTPGKSRTAPFVSSAVH